MNKVKLQGHIIIFIVNIIFALNMPVMKSLLPDFISSSGLTVARISVACVAFWIVSLFVPKEKVDKKDLRLLFVCGMCGLAFNQGAFIIGLNATSSVDASILVTCTPLFVMILAFFVLREPITLKKAGGVFLGATGAILLILSENMDGLLQKSSAFGNMMVVASGFIYSIYLVLAKPLTEKYSAITMMKWMFLFSTIVLLPFGYKDLIQAPAFIQPFQTDVILRILYVVFGATFMTYLMIPMALKRIRPTTVSMYNYVQPVIASVVAVMIGQDKMTFGKIFSAMLIFTGVYLVTVSKSRAQLEVEKQQVKAK